MRLFSSNDNLKEYLLNRGLIKRGDSLALAVSGGADSVAMLLFFHEISKELNLKLQVKHFEHGIRGDESIGDMEYVKSLCEKRNIPILVKQENILEQSKSLGLSLEETARIRRYKFLLEGDYDALLVAHNFEDQAETVLFNLIRGTGIDGLCGIKEETVREGKRIVRPLLKVSRKEIERYLAEKNIQFREDSTNKSHDYSRNKIRNAVIPLLEEININAVSHINSASNDISNLHFDYEKSLRELYLSAESPNGLKIEPLLGEAPYKAKDCIRKYIFNKIGSLKDISRLHIDEIYNLLTKETGKMVEFPGGFAEKSYENLRICGKNTKREPFDSEAICYETRVFEYKKTMEIPKGNYTKWFDYGKITSEFSLRGPKPGDYFTINEKGDKKAFNRFCIDEKIPRPLRANIPLFCLENHIIWAVGYRISSAFKITESTKEVLEIALKESDNG